MAKRPTWLNPILLALAGLALAAPAQAGDVTPSSARTVHQELGSSNKTYALDTPPPRAPAQPALLLALPAPTPQPSCPRLPERPRLRWAQVRANAQVVQNNVGNAYTLQAGWAPQLAFGSAPIGLRLLAQVSALRSAAKKVFAVPSAEMLLTWRVASHLEVDLGAGVQIWTQSAHALRPLATAEAHYLPHRKMARFIRSAFVASSLGASGGAGLQVRAGLSFDFHRQAADGCDLPAMHAYISQPWNGPSQLGGQVLGQKLSQKLSPAEPTACPACPATAACPLPPAVPEDALLATHLLFAFNEAHLGDVETAYLQELGAALSAEPQAWHTLEIVGHADSIGTDAHTQLVSARRAERVRGVLQEAGVDTARLVVRAVGEHAPIVGERPDAAGQRRVTLRLRGLHGSARLAAFVHVPAHASAHGPAQVPAHAPTLGQRKHAP